MPASVISGLGDLRHISLHSNRFDEAIEELRPRPVEDRPLEVGTALLVGNREQGWVEERDLDDDDEELTLATEGSSTILSKDAEGMDDLTAATGGDFVTVRTDLESMREVERSLLAILPLGANVEMAPGRHNPRHWHDEARMEVAGDEWVTFRHHIHRITAFTISVEDTPLLL